MKNVWIVDATRTPIGRYAGGLSSIRADDLAALPIKALMARQVNVDWQLVDDVILGCANQAGEDNRNIARMASLLAGLPVSVSGSTINRLCGSGMDAISVGARAIKAGEANLIIAGGAESMSRAPFVSPKAVSAFSRQASIEDTTIGWRFVNRKMQEQYGVDSMPETAENVAERYDISRRVQDEFAALSQKKASQSIECRKIEITPVEAMDKKGQLNFITDDEHPRANTTTESLATLRPIVREGGTITAGNASGVNDGACALLLASDEALSQYNLEPMARILGSAAAGVEPRFMGMGPVPATQKLMTQLNLSLSDFDVIELNEAFAAQGIAALQQLGIDYYDERVNPLGGAIALGHPLGMSGARIVASAAYQLGRGNSKAVCTMCVGVGQGISIVLEAVS